MKDPTDKKDIARVGEMEIRLLQRTYCSYGGHVTLGLLGDFLTAGAPDFGDAVREIDVLAYFRSTGMTGHPSLGDSYEEHHALLAGLPKYRFARKKRSFSIEYESKAASAEEIMKPGVLSLEWFRAIYNEVKEHLSVLKKKLKKADDFDYEKFTAWVEAKERDMPADAAGLRNLEREMEAWSAAREAAKDDWEKLGLDWDDFHPAARRILDDPFFWETANDFAPNGNDTGADMLNLFRAWRKRNKDRSSEEFFRRTLRDWGLSPDDEDELAVHTCDEAAIGLAFAHIKLEGACPEWVRGAALSAIHRQNKLLEERHGDWQYFDQKSRSLQLTANKLRECPQ